MEQKVDSEDNGTINSSSHRRKKGGNSVTAVGYRWKFQFGIDSTRLPIQGGTYIASLPQTLKTGKITFERR